MVVVYSNPVGNHQMQEDMPSDQKEIDNFKEKNSAGNSKQFMKAVFSSVMQVVNSGAIDDIDLLENLLKNMLNLVESAKKTKMLFEQPESATHLNIIDAHLKLGSKRDKLEQKLYASANPEIDSEPEILTQNPESNNDKQDQNRNPTENRVKKQESSTKSKNVQNSQPSKNARKSTPKKTAPINHKESGKIHPVVEKINLKFYEKKITPEEIRSINPNSKIFTQDNRSHVSLGFLENFEVFPYGACKTCSGGNCNKCSDLKSKGKAGIYAKYHIFTLDSLHYTITAFNSVISGGLGLKIGQTVNYVTSDRDEFVHAVMEKYMGKPLLFAAKSGRKTESKGGKETNAVKPNMVADIIKFMDYKKLVEIVEEKNKFVQ